MLMFTLLPNTLRFSDAFLFNLLIWDSVTLLNRLKGICRKCCVYFIVSHTFSVCMKILSICFSLILKVVGCCDTYGSQKEDGPVVLLKHEIIPFSDFRTHEASNILVRGFICSFYTAMTLAFPSCFNKPQKAFSQIQLFGLIAFSR